VRPPADPLEGITVAVYVGAGQRYAVVDDRRTIEVTGRRVLLDRIEPRAALETLVIEPLGAARGALVIEQCARAWLRSDPADVPEPGATSASAAADAARLARVLRGGRLPVTKHPDLPTSQAGPAEPDEALASSGAVVSTLAFGEPGRPLDGGASPLVECTVTGPPGRHRVRVHYVTASAGFQIRHEIAMTSPDRATISTRFTVPTPAWGARGELALYDGVPGAGDPPRELGRGPATFDGGIAVLGSPPREVPARLVRVFDGMRRPPGDDGAETAWGRGSRHDVRVLLELDEPRLLPAPAHVQISVDGGDAHDISTAYAPAWATPASSGPPVPDGVFVGEAIARDRSRLATPAPRSRPELPEDAPSGPTRIPLWLDPQLRGTRVRAVERTSRASLTDHLELTVANTGSEPREVWIEEPLRPARRRELVRARPRSPELAGGVARLRLVVAPGRIERLGVTIRYSF
jgi:hypothetical protein